MLARFWIHSWQGRLRRCWFRINRLSPYARKWTPWPSALLAITLKLLFVSLLSLSRGFIPIWFLRVGIPCFLLLLLFGILRPGLLYGTLLVHLGLFLTIGFRRSSRTRLKPVETCPFAFHRPSPHLLLQPRLPIGLGLSRDLLRAQLFLLEALRLRRLGPLPVLALHFLGPLPRLREVACGAPWPLVLLRTGGLTPNDLPPTFLSHQPRLFLSAASPGMRSIGRACLRAPGHSR